MIANLNEQAEHYDVFICYKEAAENGNRTNDSVLAQELYYELLQEGLSVFYSRITLKDKLASSFEGSTLAALDAAKVLIVLGTKPEYFNAVWLKRQWGHFLFLINQGAEKTLLPVYKDMDPFCLPDEFSKYKAQDLSQTTMQDLVGEIKKILGRDDSSSSNATEKSVISANTTETAPLLRRAHMFLEDGDFANADQYAERVLDINPECAEAYIVKLLAELGLKNATSLESYSKPIAGMPNYQKAIRFASPEYKETLKGYNSAILQKLADAQKENTYCQGVNLMAAGNYVAAAKCFTNVSAYKDANNKLEECRRLAKDKVNENLYQRATHYFDAQNFDEAAWLYKVLGDYKDSASQLNLCAESKENACKESVYVQAMQRVLGKDVDDVAIKKSIEELESIAGYKDVDNKVKALNARLEKWYEDKKSAEEAARIRAEEERLAREREAEVRRLKKLKRKKIAKKAGIIGGPIVAGVAVISVLTFTLFIPLARFNKADDLLNQGRYDEAMEIYNELGGFSDSEQRITVINAINEIVNENYEGGIYDILAAGVPVKITYGTGGGNFNSSYYSPVQDDGVDNCTTVFSAAQNLNSSLFATEVADTVEYTYTSLDDYNGLLTPSRSGYSFFKWEFESYNYQAKGTFEITFNALWTTNVYRITYNLNGGTAYGNPVRYGVNDNSFTLNNPTRNGYTFTGWTGTGLDKLTTSVTVASGSVGDRSYKANWQANSYTLSFDANGGSVYINSKTVTYDSYYSLPTPTRSNYTFDGWYYGSTKYEAGTWDTASDVTLTAKWKGNPYTVTYSDTAEIRADVVVTFDPNYSGSASSAVTLTNGQTLNYPTNPTRSGYVFTGWYTNSSCTTAYNFSGTITEDMTLYAGWATCTIKNDSSYPWRSSNGVLTSTNKGNSSTSTYKITATMPVTVSFYYKTSSESGYDYLYIKKNGATLQTCSGIIAYDYYSVSLSIGDYLEFVYKKDISNNIGDDCAYIKDLTFTSSVSYTSTATASCATTSGYVYDESATVTKTVAYGDLYTLPVITKIGYTLEGWYTEGGIKVESGSWNYTSNLILTPRWTANEYTVSLDANGGSISPTSQTATYGSEYELPTPTREGYTFDGWYNGDTLFPTQGTWNRTVGVDLTAHWTVNTYTVTYSDTAEIRADVVVTLDPNYSGSASSAVTLTNGQTLNYPTVPTRSGYAFKGWYTNSSCTTAYNFSGTITEDMTLYAGWTAMSSSYNTRQYVDVANYASSSSKKTVTISASSSSSQDYYYFTCYKTGSYTIYAAYTSGDFYITVTNVTQSKTIMSKYNLYSSQSSTSASYSANAGDVVCISLYKYYSSGSTGTGTFYVVGAGYPTSTATASCTTTSGYVYDESATVTQTVTYGDLVTLPTPTREGYTLEGWYTEGGIKVESGSWSIAQDVTLIARWTPNT